MLSRVIIFILLSITVSRAKDYTLIEQLPERLSTAVKASAKLSASGNTPDLQDAYYHSNDALIAMIKDMAKTYYSPKSFSNDEIAKYLSALYAIHHFRQDMMNPTGEFLGTLSRVDIPADVMVELVDTVPAMVKAITAEDATFDYAAWNKKWRAAFDEK